MVHPPCCSQLGTFVFCQSSSSPRYVVFDATVSSACMWRWSISAKRV